VNEPKDRPTRRKVASPPARRVRAWRLTPERSRRAGVRWRSAPARAVRHTELVDMLVRWYFTVFGVMENCFAMSSFGRSRDDGPIRCQLARREPKVRCCRAPRGTPARTCSRSAREQSGRPSSDRPSPRECSRTAFRPSSVHEMHARPAAARYDVVLPTSAVSSSVRTGGVRVESSRRVASPGVSGIRSRAAWMSGRAP